MTAKKACIWTLFLSLNLNCTNLMIIFGKMEKRWYLCGVIIQNKQIIMKTTDSYIKQLKSYLPICSSRYGVRRMGIFGSVARREQREESDVDVYIEGDLHGMFAMGSIKSELEELLGVSVDLVRLHENMNPMLLKKIRKEGIYV